MNMVWPTTDLNNKTASIFQNPINISVQFRAIIFFYYHTSILSVKYYVKIYL